MGPQSGLSIIDRICYDGIALKVSRRRHILTVRAVSVTEHTSMAKALIVLSLAFGYDFSNRIYIACIDADTQTDE